MYVVQEGEKTLPEELCNFSKESRVPATLPKKMRGPKEYVFSEERAAKEIHILSGAFFERIGRGRTHPKKFICLKERWSP